MVSLKKTKGFIAYILLLFLIAGAVGLYYGYFWYQEKYYINLFDGAKVRRLEVPPFAERKSPASLELKGECKLKVGTSFAQAKQFYKEVCRKKGFAFDEMGSSEISIGIKRNYVIKGVHENNDLILKWNPVLTSGQQKKYKSLFNEDYKPATEKKK
jgi:hypothetical protein